MKSIHRTASGRKAKELREEARTWREKAQNIRDAAPELEPAARLREEEARRLEGEALVALDRARLEAVTVYLGDVEKTSAKGTKTYRYYFASWKVGGKVKNVYIGSPRKMTREEATAKARDLKARDLGLRRQLLEAGREPKAEVAEAAGMQSKPWGRLMAAEGLQATLTGAGNSKVRRYTFDLKEKIEKKS